MMPSWLYMYDSLCRHLQFCGPFFDVKSNALFLFSVEIMDENS